MTPAEVEGFIEYLSDAFWHQDVPPGTWDQWRATVRSLSLAEAVAAVEIVKREHEFLSFHVWAEAIEVVRVEAGARRALGSVAPLGRPCPRAGLGTHQDSRRVPEQGQRPH